jgi:hypothetical protein
LEAAANEGDIDDDERACCAKGFGVRTYFAMKAIPAVLLVSLLAGCGLVQQAQYRENVQSAKLAINTHCAPIESAVAQARCAEIYLRPLAVGRDADLVQLLIAEATRLGEQIDAGKISRPEGKAALARIQTAVQERSLERDRAERNVRSLERATEQPLFQPVPIPTASGSQIGVSCYKSGPYLSCN